MFEVVELSLRPTSAFLFLSSIGPPSTSSRSKSHTEHCSQQVGVRAEGFRWRRALHTLGVNEATSRTLNSSRETNALQTLLKALSVCLFKGDLRRKKRYEHQLRKVIDRRSSQVLQDAKSDKILVPSSVCSWGFRGNTPNRLFLREEKCPHVFLGPF